MDYDNMMDEGDAFDNGPYDYNVGKKKKRSKRFTISDLFTNDSQSAKKRSLKSHKKRQSKKRSHESLRMPSGRMLSGVGVGVGKRRSKKIKRKTSKRHSRRPPSKMSRGSVFRFI